MPLSPGTRLGVYEILSPIGAGGMGEVYRAKDTRLDRDVAIKVLPESFALDADRVARFTREAKTLASLNHPNIAAIYGIEQNALVMELVEGEDLTEVIARHAGSHDPAYVRETVLPIARQIIDALEAAHEQGIVHRDLKPANIKVREDGTVKVLDFGLARTMDDGPGTQDPSNSPTLTARATQMGMILGTAAYMSPEQARGRAVDKRTDVWAFGCVLYEMLTGAHAFAGDDATEIISAVIKTEPNLNALPASIPPHVRAVVTRCLIKDRKARIPDMSVVRYWIDGSMPVAEPSSPVARPRSAMRWKAAAAISILAAIVAGAGWYRERSNAPAVSTFSIQPPAGAVFTSGNIRGATVPAISPDGQTVAFTAQDATGKRMLWTRPIDTLTAQEVPGTENAGYPFWSPDSQFIGYTITGKLMKVPARGGPTSTICTLSPGIFARGASWSRDGVVVFNNGPAPLYRVPADGGTATPMGELLEGEVGRQFPSFLPDGRHFLFSGAGPEGGGIYAGSLDSDDIKRIAASANGAVYDPTSGYLLFVQQGRLLAQTFDATSLTLSGQPFTVAEGVESAVVPGLVAFSVSETGVLVYGLGSRPEAGAELAWVDRRGKETKVLGPAARYRGISLSPDGKRLASHRHDGEGGDIYLTDLARGTSTRLTFDARQENMSPVWSPDNLRVAYGSIRAGVSGIYVKNADNTGAEEMIYEKNGTRFLVPLSWSGTSILFGSAETDTGRNLWTVSLAGDRKATPVLNTPSSESHGQLSPDGRWLAYVSNETGVNEIYVQPASGSDGKWAVSSGQPPRWRGDGRELYFLSAGKMMAVDIAVQGAALVAGEPKALFEAPTILGMGHTDHFSYAVAKDGQSFLFSRRRGSAGIDAPSPPIVAVLNWAAGRRP